MPDGPRFGPAEREILSAWLEVATKGLANGSKARVVEEISVHFHDAVERARRSGLDDNAAVACAVEALGSAREARRANRRTYLTKRQESMLRQYGEPSPVVSVGFGFLSAAVIWQAVLISPRWTEPHHPLRVAAAIGMALALIILTRINPRIYRRGSQRTAFVAGVSANFLWWSCVAIAVTGRFATAFWLAALVPVAIASYAPLARKLHDRPPQLA